MNGSQENMKLQSAQNANPLIGIKKELRSVIERLQLNDKIEKEKRYKNDKKRRKSKNQSDKETIKNFLNTRKCSLCSWDGACDIHRIVEGVNGGRYDLGNVVVLCPNCHRSVHRGTIKI